LDPKREELRRGIMSSFLICKILRVIGGTRVMLGENDKCIQNFGRKTSRTDLTSDTWKLMGENIEFILGKYGKNVWTGRNWSRRGPNHGLL
jgi:hypothetical protein